jgi:hypothetical protein
MDDSKNTPEAPSGWSRWGTRVDIPEGEPILFVLLAANAWKRVMIEEAAKGEMEIMPDSLLLVIKPRESFSQNAPEAGQVAVLMSMIGRKKQSLIVPATEMPK